MAFADYDTSHVEMIKVLGTFFRHDYISFVMCVSVELFSKVCDTQCLACLCVVMDTLYTNKLTNSCLGSR